MTDITTISAALAAPLAAIRACQLTVATIMAATKTPGEIDRHIKDFLKGLQHD